MINNSTIEERRDKAVAYFLQGYNCSQSVLLAYHDVINLDIETAKIIAAPLGGGMGRLREVCGAQTKKELYASVQQLAGEFRNQCGSIICADLLKIKRVPQDPNPSDRNSEYYAKRPCARMVAVAAEIIGRELLI
jgi:hypothetical protein